MAAQVRVRPAELRAKGGQLKAKTANLQSELQSVRSVAEPTAVFEGAASTQYQEVFNRWATSQQQMLDSLNQLGDWLTGAADALEQTDEALKNSLGI